MSFLHLRSSEPTTAGDGHRAEMLDLHQRLAVQARIFGTPRGNTFPNAFFLDNQRKRATFCCETKSRSQRRMGETFAGKQDQRLGRLRLVQN